MKYVSLVDKNCIMCYYGKTSTLKGPAKKGGIKMRKNIFSIILIFAVAFVLCGCDVAETSHTFAQIVEDKYDDIVRGIEYYSDTPLYRNDDFKRSLSAALAALSESNIENIGEFSAMARLVSRTVWGRAPMKVTFAIQDVKYGGIHTISYEDTEPRRCLDDDGLWRQLYAAQVEMWAVNKMKPLMPQQYNVVSVIVTWRPERMILPAPTHSVCDLDGDGEWDYYSSAPINFSSGGGRSNASFALEDPFGTEVVIASEDDLIEMPPLEHTTFYDIQKVMKES